MIWHALGWSTRRSQCAPDAGTAKGLIHGAKILQNRLLGPLSDCCAKTGTFEMEEVVASSFLPDNASRGKTYWLPDSGSLPITDLLITDYFFATRLLALPFPCYQNGSA